MYTILIQDLKNLTYTEDCKKNYYILTIEIKTIETLLYIQKNMKFYIHNKHFLTAKKFVKTEEQSINEQFQNNKILSI